MHCFRNTVNIHEWVPGLWEINWDLACVSTLSREGSRGQVISYNTVEAVQNFSIKSNSKWKSLTLHHSPFPVSKDSLKQKIRALVIFQLHCWPCPLGASPVNISQLSICLLAELDCYFCFFFRQHILKTEDYCVVLILIREFKCVVEPKWWYYAVTLFSVQFKKKKKHYSKSFIIALIIHWHVK